MYLFGHTPSFRLWRGRGLGRLVLLAGCAAGLLTGCATPGPPRPPSLNLPVLPSALKAERVGDRAVLSWTSSPNSTEGERLKGGITAVVCRGVPAAVKRSAPAQPANAVACNPIERFAVQPGADRAEEHLTPDLAAGPARAVFYEVELLNETGHSAGASPAVYLVAGAAPQPVGLLRITPSKAGALIRWTPAGPDGAQGSMMQLTRTQVGARPGSAAARGSARPGPAAAALPRRGAPGKGTQQGAAAEPVVLETGANGAAGTADAGGMVDPSVLDGGTYRYVAQRVLRVRVAGQTLELRGEPSAPAELAFHDIFPPAAPTGLVAVPGGGLGVAASVDLSWDPAGESDVVGFRVYRASVTAGGPGAYARLGTDAEPIPASAYRDLTVQPGGRYLYRVTAVDRLGNESVPSAVIEETVPADEKRQ